MVAWLGLASLCYGEAGVEVTVVVAPGVGVFVGVPLAEGVVPAAFVGVAEGFGVAAGFFALAVGEGVASRVGVSNI